MRRPHLLLLLLWNLAVGQAFMIPSPPMRRQQQLVNHIVASAAAEPPSDYTAPPTALLCATAALQSACFGCIGTALPPALRASGLEPAQIALTLGRLGSISALFEVMLSGWFGSLADAVGRKPILLCAPLLTVFARATVVVCPTLPMLLGARMLTTLAVPIYWLAFQATCADLYASNATALAYVGTHPSLRLSHPTHSSCDQLRIAEEALDGAC